MSHRLGAASVAGTQLVPITSPHVNYARYIVPVPDAEGSDGHTKRGQVLERAWRDLNAKTTSDVTDIPDIAHLPDAKDREVYAVLRLEEGTPALWAFGLNNEDLPELSALEVTERGTLDCRKLVLCSTHGNDLECLSTSKNRGCDVKWTPGEMERYWDRLAMAMTEGLAWRDGKRVYADRYECRLWPISNERLALVVRDRLERKDSAARGVHVHTLEPNGMSAVPLGDYHPSTAQRLELIAGINASLGPGAFDPRTMDLDSDLEVGQAQWGIYWVSTEPDWNPDDDIRRHPGRLTIWPKALCSGTTGSETYAYSPDSSSPPPLPLPPSADTSPDSLMQVATGLFDFFNTYVPLSEVDIAEITPETEVPDHLDSSPYAGSAPFGPSPTSPKSRRGSDAASDLDDLFSAGSPSPPPATKALEPSDTADTTQPTKEEGPSETSALDNVISSMAPVDPEEPDMSMDIDENMYAQMEEWEDLTGLGGAKSAGGGAQTGGDDAPGVLVTEDDFNFFDSPPPQVQVPPAEEQILVDGMAEPADPAQQTVPAPIDLTTADEDLPDSEADAAVPVPSAVHSLPTATGGSASAAIEIDDELVPDPPREQVDASSMPNGAAPVTETVPDPQRDASPENNTLVRRKTVTFEFEQSPPPPEFEDAEVVPVGYEPLDIEPALTSFKYSLPSPAASPETESPSRVELIKRMQAVSKKNGKKDDYASEWDIESEQSEEDDSEDFTGAPPTPVSLIDTEPLDSLATTPRKEAGHKDGSEGLRWEGVDVLGPDEVAELRWDGRDSSAIGWKDAWNRFAVLVDDVGNAGVEQSRILEGVDITTLFDTLLMNRHLRDLLLDVLTPEDADKDIGLGATLGDTPLPLTPCNIHVGLRDTVCQVAISALLYSGQLGIQPLGGEKDVSALLLAESDDWRSKDFLSSMSRIYETNNFGLHRSAKHSLAKQGIISLPAAGFADTLSALMPNLAPYTVVYVLLPVVEPSALAKLISRLLSVQAPTEDVVLKIVPPHAFNNDSLSEMALEVYDKITRPLVPISVRGSLIELPVTSLQYPAFTLAPLNEPKVDLSLSWPLRSYDVLNRWRLVHCAYGWNETRDRIVSFVIDSAGEGWSQLEQMVEAGKVDDALEDLYRSFVVFAKRANVEYRLSICAVGGISKGEIDYWTRTGPSSKTPVTLVVADSCSTAGSSGTRVPATVMPISGAIFADSTTRLIDETLAGTVTELPRLPVRLAASSDHYIPMASVAINIGQPESASTSVYHILSHRCPPERPDNANEVISNQFYRLACLARTRFGLGGGEGGMKAPVHVAYVRMCLRALELIKGK